MSSILTQNRRSTRPRRCPSCGAQGRVIGIETLTAIVPSASASDFSKAGGIFFCREKDCDVAYYAADGGATLSVAQVPVVIYQKSNDPTRLVCYCFGHRVNDVREEVLAAGTSATLDRIMDACRAGLDRCEETNPQGACCLGNVRALIKAALAERNAKGEEDASLRMPTVDPLDGDAHSCCASKSLGECAGVSRSTGEAAEEEARDEAGLSGQAGAARTGFLATLGALTAAVLSSACCWLPLALVAMGASTVGISGFFEAYRLPFLALALVLLGSGYYFVYRKPDRCEPGSACSRPNPMLRTTNKLMLWTATFFVGVFALFPNALTLVYGDGSAQASDTSSMTAPPMQFALSGLTCEGCAGHIKGALEHIDGVAAAEVSYRQSRALVYPRPGATISEEDIVKAIEQTGYKARPMK